MPDRSRYGWLPRDNFVDPTIFDQLDPKRKLPTPDDYPTPEQPNQDQLLVAPPKQPIGPGGGGGVITPPIQPVGGGGGIKPPVQPVGSGSDITPPPITPRVGSGSVHNPPPPRNFPNVHIGPGAGITPPPPTFPDVHVGPVDRPPVTPFPNVRTGPVGNYPSRSLPPVPNMTMGPTGTPPLPPVPNMSIGPVGGDVTRPGGGTGAGGLAPGIPPQPSGSPPNLNTSTISYGGVTPTGGGGTGGGIDPPPPPPPPPGSGMDGTGGIEPPPPPPPMPTPIAPTPTGSINPSTISTVDFGDEVDGGGDGEDSLGDGGNDDGGGDDDEYEDMAKGGIVTRPTKARVGERGPEAVVPVGPRMKYNWRRQ